MFFPHSIFSSFVLYKERKRIRNAKLTRGCLSKRVKNISRRSNTQCIARVYSFKTTTARQLLGSRKVKSELANKNKHLKEETAPTSFVFDDCSTVDPTSFVMDECLNYDDDCLK